MPQRLVALRCQKSPIIHQKRPIINQKRLILHQKRPTNTNTCMPQRLVALASRTKEQLMTLEEDDFGVPPPELQVSVRLRIYREASLNTKSETQNPKPETLKLKAA